MAETINFLGTGGIIEGNLGTANVNVNLDAVLTWTDSAYLSVANHTSLQDIFAGGGTISMWVKPNSSTSEYNRLVDKDLWKFRFVNVGGGLAGLQFIREWSGGDGAWATAGVVPEDSWSHVAVTYNDDAASNDPIIYLNGTVVPLNSDSNSSGTASATTTTLAIGAKFDGSSGSQNNFKGNIADVRIYSSILSASNIQVLASKINVSTSLGAGTSDLIMYIPVAGTSTDITDNSANSNNATAQGTLATVYDSYSVDVYDNSTTTDGTFTVTQGKVEGKALSSLALDGNGDYVNLSNTAGDLEFGDGSNDSPFTLSAWIKADDATSATIYGRDRELKFGFSSSDKLFLALYDETTSHAEIQLSTDALTSIENKWTHVVATYSGVGGTSANAGINLYVDGVAIAMTATDAGTYTAMHNNINADSRIGAYVSADYFDGDIRDFKLFDYELSAEQVASMYSNTYPQTPYHGYKMDEGVGQVNATDYGTSSTTINGTLHGNAAMGDSNGTLDLDGNSEYSLIITPNGTLSAPRGTLDLGGDFRFEDGANFTHNSGLVWFSSSDPNLKMVHSSSGRKTPTNPLVFNNLKTSSSTYFNLYMDFTVEDTFTITNDTLYGVAFRQPVYLTMGTASSSGTITGPTSGQGNFYFATEATGSKVLATDTSGLYPWVYTGNDWGWSSANNNTLLLENGDYRTTLVTDEGYHNQDTSGNNVTIQLTGDMEFDAVTVSSGDTLDLNGQRAEFIGNFTSTGNINGGGLIFAGGDYSDGNGSGNSFTSKTLVMDGGYCNPVQTTWENIFLRSGTHTIGGVRTWTNTPLFVGGTTNFTSNNTWGNITLATGSTMNGNDDTITCSGDFTTSGGLLGASAITLDGTDEYASTTSAVAVGINSAWTIEGWMKRDDGVTGNEVFVELKTASNNNNRVWFNIDTDDVQMLIYSNGGSLGLAATANQGLNDGEWHHVACTYDSTTAKIYIDGKLRTSEVISKPVDNTDDRIINIGANVGTYANGFTGSIDEVRIWSDVRTEAEIRANMFTEVSDSAAGLVQYWKFNEGTGSTASASTGNSLGLYDGGSSATDLWAGAGTFTYGTSTLVMAKSGTASINYLNGEDVYNITVNDGCTTELNCLNDSGGRLDVFGNLINNEVIKPTTSGTSGNATMSMNTGDKTLTITEATTGMASLYRFTLAHTSGTITLPFSYHKRIVCSGNGGTTVQGSTLRTTEEFEVQNGHTYNSSAATLQFKVIDLHNGSTVDLSGSLVEQKPADTDGAIAFGSTSVITMGNKSGRGVAIIGNDTGGENTAVNMPAAGDYFIIGGGQGGKNTMEKCHMASGSDVTVQGTTLGITFADSTANVHQFIQNIDTKHMLDVDPTDDDDLSLPRPTLDNSLQLTGGD